MTNSTIIASGPLGRRGLLSSAGVAAIGAWSGALIPARSAAATAVTDADILNFALNLEYLEAEFYLRAATGQGLAPGEIEGQGNLCAGAGGRKVRFKTPAIRCYAQEIAADEHAHVKFLRAALGSVAVARPKINFDHSFKVAARAAGLIGPGQRFDAFANETNFLLAAFIFED